MKIWIIIALLIVGCSPRSDLTTPAHERHVAKALIRHRGPEVIVPLTLDKKTRVIFPEAIRSVELQDREGMGLKKRAYSISLQPSILPENSGRLIRVISIEGREYKLRLLASSAKHPFTPQITILPSQAISNRSRYLLTIPEVDRSLNIVMKALTNKRPLPDQFKQTEGVRDSLLVDDGILRGNQEALIESDSLRIHIIRVRNLSDQSVLLEPERFMLFERARMAIPERRQLEPRPLTIYNSQTTKAHEARVFVAVEK